MPDWSMEIRMNAIEGAVEYEWYTLPVLHVSDLLLGSELIHRYCVTEEALEFVDFILKGCCPEGTFSLFRRYGKRVSRGKTTLHRSYRVFTYRSRPHDTSY